jgi:RNA polymerase sigma-70 factor (ECF subfamily)
VSYKNEHGPPDRSLVNRVLHGDKRAFADIVENTESLIAQIVFKMVNNTEDRKDIVQDIYLRAYEGLKDFRFHSKLSTWIGRIAYNTCINYLEKKKPLLGSFEDPADGERATSDIESEVLFSKKELETILATAIEKLSPLHKTLIMLYHQKELTYIEIAQITVLPEGTVKSYLFRARKQLKDNLLNQYKKEEL